MEGSRPSSPGLCWLKRGEREEVRGGDQGWTLEAIRSSPPTLSLGFTSICDSRGNTCALPSCSPFLSDSVRIPNHWLHCIPTLAPAPSEVALQVEPKGLAAGVFCSITRHGCRKRWLYLLAAGTGDRIGTQSCASGRET